MGRHRYLLALGSNRRHHRFGRPRDVIGAAVKALRRKQVAVLHLSPIMDNAPLGPSLRRYANAVAVVETRRKPRKMLALCKAIERKFGRRRGGQRWSARVLDLDIVLWDRGCYVADGLIIPHPLFRERRFVLLPACIIAPQWRDPVTHLTMRQLTARLTAPRPLSR